jgi:UDP-2,4-diacetamido-2,4,6-trideoxy-beta-L-altropyranose hydrolase
MSVSPALVTLRPADVEDCRRVWLWRNDEETRRASFDSSSIPFEAHERWFAESLRNPDRKMYIVIAGDQPSGVIRLDIAGRQGTVNIHLAPQCRGHGLGAAALDALCALAFGKIGLRLLLAAVKPHNHSSLAAFGKAGFTASPAGPIVLLAKVREAADR